MQNDAKPYKMAAHWAQARRPAGQPQAPVARGARGRAESGTFPSQLQPRARCGGARGVHLPQRRRVARGRGRRTGNFLKPAQPARKQRCWGTRASAPCGRGTGAIGGGSHTHTHRARHSEVARLQVALRPATGNSQEPPGRRQGAAVQNSKSILGLQNRCCCCCCCCTATSWPARG